MSTPAIYFAALIAIFAIALIVLIWLQDAVDKLRADVARTAINVDIMATRLIALRSDMQLVERKLADICGPRQPGE